MMCLQHLFNKVLYQNASKRDIQHIRSFAQSAHATIQSALTKPLLIFPYSPWTSGDELRSYSVFKINQYAT
jgi:hypothetical protein